MAYAPHVVAETEGFIGDCKEAGVSAAELISLIDEVARDPQGGDLVRGSGGVRKRRFPGKGKGKSGGYRVMAAYAGEGAPVYLLALLSKNDAENFDADDIAEMHKLMQVLKKEKKR